MKKLDIRNKVIIGMIHLPATLTYQDWPGLSTFIEKAKRDLLALEMGGIDAALIENDADSPCQVLGKADVVAPVSIVAYELAKISKIPLGVEILLNDPMASLAIAKTCGLSFIRTDYFVDRMTRDNYGEFEIDATKLMEYRHKIKADDIQIYADVQVKYATMIDQNKTIEESVNEAILSGADGVIVTGKKTGEQPIESDLKIAKEVARGKVPVIVGSGLSCGNVGQMFKYANWAIVGSSIKTDGFVDVNKVKELVAAK